MYFITSMNYFQYIISHIIIIIIIIIITIILISFKCYEFFNLTINCCWLSNTTLSNVIFQLLYFLSASNHPEEDLHVIQQKAIYNLFLAWDIKRTFVRSVVFASTSFGGNGIGHLHTESCIQQISTIICHLHAKRI